VLLGIEGATDLIDHDAAGPDLLSDSENEILSEEDPNPNDDMSEDADLGDDLSEETLA